MKTQTKHNHLLTAILIFTGVFVVYEMYKVWNAGTAALSDILLAPINALKAVWTGVSNAASAAGSAVSNAASTVANNYAIASTLPALTQQEVSDAQAQGSVAASYQPGGTMYNTILATQGQAAADAAAQTAANNAATQQQQANADASWWGTKLFSWI
ncbi:MAG TPA: hypothetical protein VNV43_00220 [Candidatus Acidoferrales bacterium]|jgi:hypothetical protein|nr:hypothetical protein [Candidatus Acidoferrales bacterium]